LVIMAALGGLASIWGAAFGVGIIYVLKEVLRARLHVVLHGAGGEHEIIVFGLLLVAIMIFMPGGLSYGVSKAFGWVRSRFGSWRGEEKEVEPQAGQAA
jgi:branched-chain amino acid transport system permease protein